MSLAFSGLLREAAYGFRGDRQDYEPILNLIGDASIVLLGESTHGTHEFYEYRAAITRRLITEYGFSAVAVEADWPDAYRVNRFVQHVSEDQCAIAALSDFKRFPLWMWRNAEMQEFIEWLRDFNSPLEPQARTGFYGLDLYSLYGSMAAVLLYLDQVDPAASLIARKRYESFAGFSEDPKTYGFASMLGITMECEQQAVNQLLELQKNRFECLKRNGLIKADLQFCAEQNARIVCNAEEYYRAMFQNLNSTWNMRDTHMFETLRLLKEHLDKTRNSKTKIVVWEHNSHVGDARATDMSKRRELNLGQLVREYFKNDARTIGFTTSTGSVLAASFWDGPAENKTISAPHPDSYEAIFSDSGLPGFFLPLGINNQIEMILSKERLERAIGVIYLPETERYSHYFHANICSQFDAVLHIEKTQPLRALDDIAYVTKELPETFPTGI